MEIERETGNPVGIADALGNLAQVLVEAGELPRALSLHRESLILRRDIGDWLSIPYSLESIGAAAVGAGIVAPAVRLLAASDALRQATGAPIPPTDRHGYDAVIGQAKDKVGEDLFAAIWRDGQLLGRDAAVEAALALCDAIDAGQGRESESPVTPVIEMASRTSGPSP
ncbi:MAG TPA: hypothetical protein VK356_00330 [Thermomicrobiales bacterium]|nr:hypothetical protein [Thermomicrobiales bacterium]